MVPGEGKEKEGVHLLGVALKHGLFKGCLERLGLRATGLGDKGEDGNKGEDGHGLPRLSMRRRYRARPTEKGEKSSVTNPPR